MTIPLSKQFIYGTTIAILTLASCKKTSPVETPPPVEELEYINLDGREIKSQGPSAVIDINKDNTPDLVFGVVLIGDPLNMVDKTQFRVGSGIYTKLPVNNDEQAPVLNKADAIPLNNFNGFSWYEISSIILIERTLNTAGTITWGGNWKNAVKKYLPVQVLKNQQRFNGWVELSADTTNEKIILHRAAISKVPEKQIRAGI